MTREEAERFVLAECTETGRTVCFARLDGRAETRKDPFRPRKKITEWRPRYGLSPLYSGEYGNWGGLEVSPFWRNPRLVKKDEIPTGVKIP